MNNLTASALFRLHGRTVTRQSRRRLRTKSGGRDDEVARVLSDGFRPTGITNRGVYMGSTFLEHPPSPLPVLDASALLDPRGHCVRRSSARTTISGADAMVRLARSRDALHRAVHDGLLSGSGYRRICVLRGHGVPELLLKHHLTCAQQWLQGDYDRPEPAVRVTFSGHGTLDFRRASILTKNAAVYGDPPRMREWPEDWHHDVQLYLTVVHRMATSMAGLAFGLYGKGVKEHPGTRALKNWSVAVASHQILLPELWPEGMELSPIVEWLPSPSSSTQRVSIQMQAQSTFSAPEDSSPVSVAFEALFLAE